jgi:metal-sulfur cluster biosynthetic enzyme
MNKKTKEDVKKYLGMVLDPELGIDIDTLGLIYDITVIDEERVHIIMTYTTPMCPAGPIIQEDIKNTLEPLGFAYVDIEITFDPPWQPPEGLREMMGL